MVERYGPVVLGLLIVGVMLALRLRRIGRGERLPLIGQASSPDRRKVQIYVTVLGVFAMVVTAGIAIWSLNAAE